MIILFLVECEWETNHILGALRSFLIKKGTKSPLVAHTGTWEREREREREREKTRQDKEGESGAWEKERINKKKKRKEKGKRRKKKRIIAEVVLDE